jgi:hypothetical protein
MIRSVWETITRGASCVAAGAPRGHSVVTTLLLLGCDRGVSQLAVTELRPLRSWNSTTDSVFAAPIDISVAGCRAAVVDFGTRLLLVKDSSGPWRAVGRQGGGPGEYQQPGRVALLPNRGVVVLDQSQQRFVTFAPDGSPLGPPFARMAPYRHPSGGKLVAIDDSTLANYEFAARIPWKPIPDSALGGIPLVARMDLAGVTDGGWGHPVASDSDDPTDVWRVNSGAIAIAGGRMLVLRRSSGVLEEYGLADGTLRRSDSLELLVRPGSVETDGVAGSVAVLGDGRVIAVLRGPTDVERSGNGLPPEWIVVLDEGRREVARYVLTTRLTHLVAAGGGYLLALGSPGPMREDEGDLVIDLLLVPGADSTDSCGWSHPSSGD